MLHILNRRFDPRVTQSLIQAGYLAPIARALSARGVKGPDDLKEDWLGMIPPQNLEGTLQAAQRLYQAYLNKEPVTIVADYDCDGATACAVGIRGLKMMGIQADYFVPDRVLHGYGLTPMIVDILSQRTPKPTLIVTVDNGMSSAAAVEHAKSQGMDVIITDHHLPGAELPQAYTIVNPNLTTSCFGSKSLAGVGVIYYVLLALRAYMREQGVFTPQTQPRLDQLVDLVALGTVADVVKLDKNNRILVAQGWQRIKQGKTIPGIQALLEIAGKSCKDAKVRDFSFTIAPRINAAGRIGTMENGIECLLSDDPTAAYEFAQSLNEINSERRDLEVGMQQLAEAKIEQMDASQRATIVLYDETFSEGVVGLVAARIKDRTHRPVIAFAPTEGGELKGSGRSIASIHLRDVLDLVSKRIPGVILRFGGHAMAAGLSLSKDGLERFTQTFEDVVREMSQASTFDRVVMTDGGLAPDEITEELCLAIENQIWGQGFEEPIFANECRILHQTLLKDAHLKLLIEIGGQRFDGIFFRRRDPLPEVCKIAYRPMINEFRGRRSVQLRLEAAH